ncbi:hypothetical protein LJE72_15525 [Desulfosporosinus sp. SRJS8]|nr:hypothetical protein [Desulfosporosinus sp. SRJS8]
MVACILFRPLDQKPKKEVNTFLTVTTELLKLMDWIEGHKCSHVPMESTGVYWKPVWNILEVADFRLILANAQQKKSRKNKD